MKETKAYIVDPIHHTWCWIIVGDWKKFVREVKKYDKFKDIKRETNLMHNGSTAEVGEGSSIIYLRTKDISVLVHELQHFVLRTLWGRGYTWSNDSDEVYCYTLEYFVKEALSKLGIVKCRKKQTIH